MVSAADIASAVGHAVSELAVTLRPDVLAGLESASRIEPSPRGRRVLEQLLANAEIARRDRVPLCQDTGTVWVWVELGEAEAVPEGLRSDIDAVVAQAYRDNALRMSVVRDALFDRRNTQDNTPAFVDVTLRPGRGATVHVMLKGGGSDNASSVVMLPPSAGVEGVRRVVLETVEARASSACPPLILGVGVGGTFDSVAKLAKKALLRGVGSTAESEDAAELERSLLEAVNATGIGPAGLGGRTTALAVHLVTAPCHIAALPVAVNVGCSAMRSLTVELA